MRCFSLSSLVSALVAATIHVADAKIVTIRSTADAPFFDPVNATAEVGDVLEFHFAAHNRSIVQGTVAFPCQPIDRGGFYSGFFTVEDTAKENGTVFRVTVNDTSPIVYYCSQDGPDYGNHCKKGMSGVVNQPDMSQLESYQEAASTLSYSITPDSPPFGGVFAENPDDTLVGNTTTEAPSSTSAGFMSGVPGRMIDLVGGALAVLVLSSVV